MSKIERGGRRDDLQRGPHRCWKNGWARRDLLRRRGRHRSERQTCRSGFSGHIGSRIVSLSTAEPQPTFKR
jgi:hypothetical protein